MKNASFFKQLVTPVVIFIYLFYAPVMGQITKISEPWKTQTERSEPNSNARVSAGLSTSGTITYDGTGAGTTGDSSAYFGLSAGRISTGLRNVFIGNKSGYSNTTASDNIFIGTHSGLLNTTDLSSILK
jgi:hypothetical protein